MPKAKTTGRHASVKIAEGSALDRLTRGKSFTVVVHAVFEEYEGAGGGALLSQDIELPASEVREVKPVTVRSHTMPKPQKRFRIPQFNADGTTTVLDLSETEAMELAAQQYPSGLMPVLDEYMAADENEVLREVDEALERDTDDGDTRITDDGPESGLTPRQVAQDFDYADLA